LREWQLLVKYASSIVTQVEEFVISM